MGLSELGIYNASEYRTLASCPIDRKPFQAVFKFSALEGCVKVQVKKQLRETKDKKNENSFFKKQLSCPENSRSCMRKKILRMDLLNAGFYDLKMIHRKFKCSEIGGKKSKTINKPQRSNHCSSQCFQNFFSSMFSSDSHIGESSFTQRMYCTDYLEISEISALVRQKRQELELSWFPDTVPGIGRISLIPWDIETEVLPLISTVLPRTIFPTNTISLENFDTSCKEYALAHTQEGEEKKQTSGTSNTRGSRRKPAATPTRRSTRNMRAEAVSQSQESSVSNNSGCDAPDNSNPSVSEPSSAESEKQTRQAPKRKSVRRARKPPLLKKKLRSSVLPPDKSSGDSVDEEAAESDIPPVPVKEHQSDVEGENTCTVQAEVESESANELEKCSEQVEESERQAESHDTQEEVAFSFPEFPTQDNPVLAEEDKAQSAESTAEETSAVCLAGKSPESASEKAGDSLEDEGKVSEQSGSEVTADRGVGHPSEESLTCSEPDTEGHPPVPSLNDLPEGEESVAKEEKVIGSPIAELMDHKDSTEKTEEFVEDGIVQTADTESVEGPKVQLLGRVETEGVETGTVCDTAGNESVNIIQDSENNLLKNTLITESDKPVEDKTESLVEHLKSSELPNTHIEQIQKHFSEDNNEMIPMECDSLCSDHNESEIEQSVSADAKQLDENSVEHCSQNNAQVSDAASEKVVSQPSECSVDKAKKPRTRKSRFHSPSTTWSPNNDSTQEQKRSQSPSPKRETGKENRKSRSPSPKKESARGRRKSRSQSPRKDVARERKPSQTRSPKRDRTREGKRSESLSPKRDNSRENRRSQSRVKESSPREKSRSRSRERESDRDGQRRDRDRERRSRRWSRSRSRSRSPSRSRTKNKSSLFGRNDRDNYSRWKERWANDGWRCPRGNDRYRKNDPEKQNENTRKEKSDISPDADDPNSADKHRNNCPSWVTEKINSGPDPRTRNPEKLKDSHWEENRNENSGNSWNKNFSSSWVSKRGRGGRGRGSFRGGFACAEQSEGRWQNRDPLSGGAHSPGNEPFRFAEQQPCKRKDEREFSFDTPADRSGWTSASSWAVRKTLPADVQSYYSRRGRHSSGPQAGWMRQEEETAEQDSNIKDQTNQQSDGSQLPINMMQPQMNVMPQQMNAQHQPMNIFPYPVGVHAPLMNIPRHPYNIHPQLPLHLHPGVPLMPVAAPASISQGLPPPPPPPPPSQHVNYIASQPDGKQLQGVSSAPHVSSNTSTPVVPAPPAAPGSTGAVQGPSSGNTSSSSHSKASNAAMKVAEGRVSATVEASADSSKTDKKLQIQEKAAQEVKLAIKPFYQNKDITKEEYKEIVRKAVDKVCHSKSGEVNSAKVANLVKAYVDKYKYSRKGSQKKTLEEAVSTEKNIG
ncbi:protein SCAF11 isoform X2 [Sorex araneus]|uniref:protein SCAF11 isoform X2 n=1 Tax=Sorex araneus TaxID=42254 RepID=UPI002433CE25|nr:protein SCAF11 isoform X2 [Sorex araneus]